MADEERKTTRSSPPKREAKGQEGPKLDETYPADLELHSGALVGGEEPKIKKTMPEVPTQQQVDASTGEVPGPLVTTATVDGEEVELDPETQGIIQTRASAKAFTHPGLAPDFSNPVLREPTEEEKEADAKEYEKRFAGTKT